MQRDIYVRTLACAVETLGSRSRLEKRLDISPGRLSAWLAGKEAPPLEVFLDALDIVADGPYARIGRRRIRVAVLRGSD
jgi:hypothetical protein